LLSLFSFFVFRSWSQQTHSLNISEHMDEHRNPTTTKSLSHAKEGFLDVFASTVGSAACTYSGQPFDTVKVRLQVNSALYSNSFFNCLRTTVKNEGIWSLWKGSVPAFLGAMTENVVAFAVNGLIKRYYLSTKPNPEEKSVGESIVLGAISGAICGVAYCPCDVVKCRTQVNVATGVGATDSFAIAKEVFQKRGVRGLFAGVSAQVLRDTPFYATFFGLYDVFCGILRENTKLSDSAIYFLSGGFAGQLGWVVSIGADTIKSRMQTSDNPQGIIATGREIYRLGGWKGFFSGVEAAMIRAFPANAALFLGYEVSRRMMSDVIYR
jgi:solute carrier family 25 ornithine transporter 2/15